MPDTLADLKPVYLIYGSEQLLLDQALARLTGRFEEAGGTDFDIDRFDGESASADSIIGAANTLPFGAERRLVVVRSADKLGKSGLDALAAYASDPSPYAVLVLVAEKIAKNTKLFKAVDKLGGASEFKAPKPREYPSWVSQAFAARGRKASPDAAELLVRSVGRDLRHLEVEIEKVIAYAGSRTEISREDVAQVVSATATASVFEFLDALGDRDCTRAMRLLAQLVSDGESVHGLHAMSVRRVRDLIAAESLAARGERGVAALASELRRPDWQVRQLPRQAERFSEGELVGALNDAAQAEAQMKTGRDPRLVFERWVLGVCGV